MDNYDLGLLLAIFGEIEAHACPFLLGYVEFETGPMFMWSVVFRAGSSDRLGTAFPCCRFDMIVATIATW